MFNRRPIACPYCGFLCLKRDAFCDRCNRPTTSAHRTIARALVIATAVAIVALMTYVKADDAPSALTAVRLFETTAVVDRNPSAESAADAIGADRTR